MRTAKKKRSKNLLHLIIFLFSLTFIVGISLLYYQKANVSHFIRRLTVEQHSISYNGETFVPEFKVIKLGDSVSFKNNSQTSMEIAVGRHENHRILKGFKEKILEANATYTFIPEETGVFYLHDHLNPKNLGFLIVDNN